MTKLIHCHGGKHDLIKLPTSEGRLGSTVALDGESYELTEEIWAGTGQSKTLEYVEAHLVRN